MKTLLVMAHPRRSSLTAKVTNAFAAAAGAKGHELEWADLAAENFDPVLREADEPDWNDPDKVYSEEVRREMQRIERNEATVMVFPVFWWSMPALLKGWIDRVWNNGWAYGDRKLKHRKALLLGTAAGSAESYAKRGYDQAMRTQIVTGMMEYCGIPDSELHLLFDVLDDRAARDRHLAMARELGESYFGRVGVEA